MVENKSSHLRATIDAFAKEANLDYATIQGRNCLLDQQLNDNYLLSIDIIGDGNCFYTAVFCNLRRPECMYDSAKITS